MKSKRIVIILLCLMLLCSGCGVPVLSRKLTFDSTKYLAAFQNNWCYRYLDAALQADYGDLYTAVTDGMENDVTVKVEGDMPVTGYGTEVTLSHPLSSADDVRRLYLAFSNDNPQFFFLERHYGMYGYQVNDTLQYSRITLLFSMNAADRRAALEKITDRTQAILAKAASETTAFGKELLLHDWLTQQCTYDTRSDTAPAASYTLAGALTDGKAVCEGYSRAMQWLLQQSGIACTVVAGDDRKGQAHMWNLVTVDGKNYHLDVTWDDTDDLLRHNYFNLTTAQAAVTHGMTAENIGVDTCTATEANYFQYTGCYLDTYSRHEIAAAVARAVQAGEERIELRFAEGKYDNAVLFVRSGDYFFNAVNAKLQGKTMWPFTLYGEQAEGIIMLCRS